VYELRTRSGYRLKLTGDHLVFTENRGDVKACELRKDDVVRLVGAEFGRETAGSPEIAQLIGLLVGDGCITKTGGKTAQGEQRRVSFLTVDKAECEVAEWANALINELLRVHVPRRLGVQPGASAQPPQVPPRGRLVRRRGLPAGVPHLLHRAGDPRRPLERTDRRKRSRRTRHDYRPLGLGYANLGSLLMVMGVPYDSEKGRAIAAALTAIMCGHAYKTAPRWRRERGPSPASPRTASRCCA
jgi:hypothetical protein